MSSYEPHRTEKLAASLVAIVCAVAPSIAASQTELEFPANDEAEPILDAIAAAEIRGGPRSAELISPYTELALFYEEASDHELALAAINQALHVVRTNFGLYSLEQVPLLRLSAQIEEARGNTTGAWGFEREVFALAKRNPNDLDAVPIFRQLADKFGGPLGVQARSEAIGVLLRHGLYASEEIRAIEMELVRDSFYSVAQARTTTLVRGPAYEAGSESLRRVASYQDMSGAPLLARVEALVAIADWDLLFKEKGTALEAYEQVHALLTQEGVAQSEIDRIFAPAVPVLLPSFRLNPLAAEPPADSLGYIEIAFEIGKYGLTSGIDVLDTSTISNETVERNLVNWVRHNRFRPRADGGEIGHSAPVVARYYVKPCCSSAPAGG